MVDLYALRQAFKCLRIPLAVHLAALLLSVFDYRGMARIWLSLFGTMLMLWIVIEGRLVWRYRSLKDVRAAWAFRSARRNAGAKLIWIRGDRDMVSFVNRRSRTVFLQADYRTWRTAAIVGFHELGHLRADRDGDRYDSRATAADYEGTVRQARSLYREEQRAWQWAMLTMPPFLHGEARCLRRWAMKSYRFAVQWASWRSKRDQMKRFADLLNELDKSV